MPKLLGYIKSFYTILALILGGVMYVTYAIPNQAWGNKYLIMVAGFVALFLPYYTKLSEWFERKAVLMTSYIFLGKLIRFAWQFLFNLSVIVLLIKGGIVLPEDLEIVGGLYSAVAITTLGSQGMQYLSIALANRDIGSHYKNVTFALGTNVVISALASMGIVWIQYIFIAMGIVLGFIGTIYSLITDIMGKVAPKGGVGIFFGTFNPAHNTHMSIVKQFIKDRGLSKVYIHPTVVPRMHAKLLRDGVIRIAKMENGMRIYEKTEKADAHIDYFPTGNKFYEVENRLAMLREIVRDYQMENQVEVIYYPKEYESDGFYSVIKQIRKLHKGERIHGLHGSDYGGMLVRAIYDESTGIWPCAIVRKDNVSATAIRNGAQNMTSPTVTKILEVLKDYYKKSVGEKIEINGSTYVYKDHCLVFDQPAAFDIKRSKETVSKGHLEDPAYEGISNRFVQKG